MGDDVIFEKGAQLSKYVSVFDEPPPFWDIFYGDTLYARFASGVVKDNREDFTYEFRFYSNLDTTFCEYSRDRKKEIIRLESNSKYKFMLE